MELEIINPKRVSEKVEVRPNWYSYYAGYSHTFIGRIIKSADLSSESIILDPWNGAGTSTTMASVYGYRSIGIDLNPAMVVIAKAKLAINNDSYIVKKNIRRLSLQQDILVKENDPLLAWLDVSGVKNIRRIERSILEGVTYSSTDEKVRRLTAPKCLLYTALFNILRAHLNRFIPSNPTWIKRPKHSSEKITIEWSDLKYELENSVNNMLDDLLTVQSTPDANLAQLINGSSEQLPLENNSIDFVITSPPYCTRIDYGVATLPELSVISVEGVREIDLIRRKLMGTTTVPKIDVIVGEMCGTECLSFLDNVRNHESKASKTYYYKNLSQYFSSLSLSICEISRVLKPGAKFLCVVQDSYYKDIHCDLPTIVADMAKLCGFYLIDRVEFESKHNMANVNMKSKRYRPQKIAFENVLIFKKREKNE